MGDFLQIKRRSRWGRNANFAPDFAIVMHGARHLHAGDFIP
jgi:hypothetical protein